MHADFQSAPSTPVMFTDEKDGVRNIPVLIKFSFSISINDTLICVVKTKEQSLAMKDSFANEVYVVMLCLLCPEALHF